MLAAEHLHSSFGSVPIDWRMRLNHQRRDLHGWPRAGSEA
jgi:hypothetical protein